jgi:hypothetical protein
MIVKQIIRNIRYFSKSLVIDALHKKKATVTLQRIFG